MELKTLEQLLIAHKEEFNIYERLLLKWNKAYNLTSITDHKEIWEKHFLDSMAPLQYLIHKRSLLDVGTGGGFPGIPLKIAHPLLSVTLLEPTEKKCLFCEAVIRELGLKTISVVHGRAEDKDVIEKLGGFEAVISRATFELGKLTELCRPYLKNERSIIVSMRGKDDKETILNSPGLKVTKVERYTLPSSDSKRSLIICGSL
ncbi:MAG: 16S rRNA (guanine(527)-N(7))-methyltransferase RsmG [Deltaproteobacteria bacterium CG_4_10_14_0_2_um_filter_43_8]|nr:MAG: 16S rRNA (guanine(527)-N(7))-methyltransferase RsmG [Deltaproteobacteria bacterium CG11_big_fil_rev_8_21_14_0_20_49_13]PJA20324.1 MAG: 16S rRNA (guanine(527)-N(7))-methyltransferase RsmG [Deltaproteobacteria bacterium CG_4_10_14_0_2_um_filter_43_8]